MKGDSQQVTGRADPEQPRSQQAIVGDVERALRVRARFGLGRVGGLLDRAVAPVDDIEGREVWARDLSGLTVDLDEPSAQHVMAALDFFKGGNQGCHLERARDADGSRNVVRGTGASEQLEEPQSLLRDRQRPWRLAGLRTNDPYCGAGRARVAQEREQLGLPLFERVGEIRGQDARRRRHLEVAVVLPETDVLVSQQANQRRKRTHSVSSTAGPEPSGGPSPPDAAQCSVST